MKRRLVIFSGSGVSRESGISTFRNDDGFWKKYKVEDVATKDAWKKGRENVLDFHNMLRIRVLESLPNKAHEKIAELEDRFSVDIITQNIDNLHERAGSSSVIHLHGEISKCRSSLDSTLKYSYDSDITIGQKCEKGSQIRPDVVWFGENIQNLDKSLSVLKNADILLIIGTSLQVYPASDLINYIPRNCKSYLIDPEEVETNLLNLTHIKKLATEGIVDFIKLLN